MNIKELINHRLGELGITPSEALRRAAAKAEEAKKDGLGEVPLLSSQRLSQLRRKPVRIISGDHTLLALAHLLQVPVRRVADAALHSIGVLTDTDTLCNCTTSEGGTVVVVSDNDRTPEEVARITQAVHREIRRERQRMRQMADRVDPAEAG